MNNMNNTNPDGLTDEQFDNMQAEFDSDQYNRGIDKEEPEEYYDDEPMDMTDVEADADTLRSAGWGTDEDYGFFGGGDFYGDE